jgi:hypothetical protein
VPTGAAPAAAHQATPARAPAPPQTGREEARQTDQFESTRSLQRTIGNSATGRVVRALGPGHAAFSRGGGLPLPPSVRSEMEARFGTDFSAVRIHAGGAAERLARAHDAVAYASGVDITLGPGSDGPDTAAGKRLLAHELAHIVQASKAGPSLHADTIGPAAGIDERDADAAAAAVAAGRTVPALRPAHASILRQAAPTAAVSGIGLSVSLSGLDFDVPDEVTYKPGRRTPQLLTIVLRRLVGDAFKEDLLSAAATALDKLPATRRIGGFRDRTPAKGGERVGHISFGLRQSLVLIGLLKDRKLEVALSPSQEDLLVLGFANLNLWVDFLRAVRESGLELPRWYTKDIFDREMSQQGALLREYADQLRRFQQGDESAAQDRGVVGELIPALMQPVSVLDEIRKDIALAGDEKTASPYAALWQLPKAPKGQQPKVTSPPTHLRNSNVAVLILGYMRTQKDLALQADAYHDARRQLLTQFAAYTERIFYEGSPGKTGDEEIRDRPATANARAFPSTLAPMSGTAGPLYEAALGTDHRFHMEVQFPSVYEALGRYGFTWERVRIPDEQIGQAVDPDKLKGDKVTGGEVASVRFSRATAYNKADINRVADSMAKDLGPAGIGALELAGANAILRYVGTGIRVALELLTMPADQKLVVFPTPGLYMVRARMAQVLEGGEEVVRVPSVAYYPVLARNPDEMASAGVQAIVKSKQERKKRVDEIQKQLAEGKLEPDERKRLEQELADLRARDASLSERLETQRKTAQDQLDRIKAGGEGSQEDAEDALKAIDKRIALRRKRGVGEDAESLTARFVSDLGQVVPLVMEVVDKTPPNAKANFHRVYVSDVTTPKSGDDTGTGKTRDDAIVDAVKTILEGTEGYGRGRVSIALSGGVRTIRIEASVGSILSESVENVTTALSLAAVVAAPFTAGTSLGFLVPLGMVGAIPSAYRVYTHVESGTFSLDIQEATDIANIAGSVIGLGRMGATSLKWVRVGRGLMIVGFGIDAAGGLLMGASLMEQINALEKLPPGERSAQLLMLIGQQLMQGGILVGGSLAEHGSQRAAEHGPTKVKGLGGGEHLGAGPSLDAPTPRLEAPTAPRLDAPSAAPRVEAPSAPRLEAGPPPSTASKGGSPAHDAQTTPATPPPPRELPGARADAATPAGSEHPVEQKPAAGGEAPRPNVPSTVEVASARKQITELMDTARASGGGLEPGRRAELHAQFKEQLAKTSYPKKQKQALTAEFERLIEPPPPPIAQGARLAAGAEHEAVVAPAQPTQVEGGAPPSTATGPVGMAGGPGNGGKGPRLVPPPPAPVAKPAARPGEKSPPPPATSKRKPTAEIPLDLQLDALEERASRTLQGHPHADRVAQQIVEAHRLSKDPTKTREAAAAVDELRKTISDLEETPMRGTGPEAFEGATAAKLRIDPVWEPPAGATPRPPDSAPADVRTEWLRERLQQHVDAARARYEEAGLTPRQEAAAGQDPRAIPRFRGTQIDGYAKATVMLDPELAHVISTPDRVWGPDFIDASLPSWFDITTRRAWAAHLRKYARKVGSGTLLPTEPR